MNPPSLLLGRVGRKDDASSLYVMRSAPYDEGTLLGKRRPGVLIFPEMSDNLSDNMGFSFMNNRDEGVHSTVESFTKDINENMFEHGEFSDSMSEDFNMCSLVPTKDWRVHRKKTSTSKAVFSSGLIGLFSAQDKSKGKNQKNRALSLLLRRPGCHSERVILIPGIGEATYSSNQVWLFHTGLEELGYTHASANDDSPFFVDCGIAEFKRALESLNEVNKGVQRYFGVLATNSIACMSMYSRYSLLIDKPSPIALRLTMKEDVVRSAIADVLSDVVSSSDNSVLVHNAMMVMGESLGSGLSGISVPTAKPEKGPSLFETCFFGDEEEILI